MKTKSEKQAMPPRWRGEPTQEGLWLVLTDQGTSFTYYVGNLEHEQYDQYWGEQWSRWYGPIPSPPAAPKRRKRK